MKELGVITTIFSIIIIIIIILRFCCRFLDYAGWLILIACIAMGGVHGWHSVPFRTSSPADESPLGYTRNYMLLIMNTKLEVLST